MYDICDIESGENVSAIYYEPVTQSFWCDPQKNKPMPRFVTHKEDLFPTLDSECVSKINKKIVGTDTFKLTPKFWITMS